MRKSTMVCVLAATTVAGACGDAVRDPVALEGSDAQASIAASGTAVVSNTLDSGPGSFRDAIAMANADASIRRIQFEIGSSTVALLSTVAYTGPQQLFINGRGATLDAAQAPFDSDAFASIGGGGLILAGLTIQNASGNGVFVELPANASGTVHIALERSTIRASGKHGLHVDDQIGSVDNTGADSPASIDLLVVHSTVEGTGFRQDVSDFDGIRVDEGGPGDITYRIRFSHFFGNAADGIELDETGDGDVIGELFMSTFDDNGTQPQNPSDLEDGFDIDESDAGSIRFIAQHVSADRNFDEGIDLDEEGTGDIVAIFRNLSASDNENGITLTEDENNLMGGNIDVEMNGVTTNGNTGDGIKLEEFGPGDLNGVMRNSFVNDNADDGLQVEQQDAGQGQLRLINVEVLNNGDDAINEDNVVIVILP